MKSLKDEVREARQVSQEATGKQKYFQPPTDKDVNIRILEWHGHTRFWTQNYVHYIQGPEGKRMLTCGNENCYTCLRLSELAQSNSREDRELVRQSSRKLKVLMYILDWDNRSQGPQLWEPKNTQNCATWYGILAYLEKDEYGENIYRFNAGRIITMRFAKERRKSSYGSFDMTIQRSLICGIKNAPLPFKLSTTGEILIQVPLADGTKRIFKIPDLGEVIAHYDEDYHREVWGDSPATTETTSEIQPETPFAEAEEGFSNEFTEGEGGFSDAETEKPAEEGFENDEKDADDWGSTTEPEPTAKPPAPRPSPAPKATIKPQSKPQSKPQAKKTSPKR